MANKQHNQLHPLVTMATVLQKKWAEKYFKRHYWSHDKETRGLKSLSEI